MDEGDLTKMRARLVNKHALAMVSKNIGLQQFLKISFGTEKNFDKAGETIIADAFEALVAAIYFDAGIDKAVAFIYKNVLPLLQLDIFISDTNYKSKLLEFVQKVGKKPPIYNVLLASGPDHDREYTMGVFVDDVLIGSGKGKNKKEAEQNAANNALDNLNIPETK
jgi:ribonuclease-3